MYSFVKRMLDVVLGSIASIFALPIALVVAILLFFTQRVILFRQLRPGLRGRPFTLYKFCSMSNARDAAGNLLPDQQRLTRVGSFIRSLSLDELPQLWNVLKGDMALVGPRPLLMSYLGRYTPEQARRHDVKPGITGWAQINGRNSLDWDEKFSLDLWYVEHRSLSLDFYVLFRTLVLVLRRQGISSQSHATMPEFLGAQSVDAKPSSPLDSRGEKRHVAQDDARA